MAALPAAVGAYAPLERLALCLAAYSYPKGINAFQGYALDVLSCPFRGIEADSLLNVYLHEHLVLQLAGKELEWIWIGRELESENLFCYLQVEGVAKADGLTVSNSLLQDVFDEQDNIVHLEANGRTLTKHFIRGVSTGTFATE